MLAGPLLIQPACNNTGLPFYNRSPPAVWTSTLQRTITTASGLPYAKVQWKALDEIQVGAGEGGGGGLSSTSIVAFPACCAAPHCSRARLRLCASEHRAAVRLSCRLAPATA